MDDKLQRQLNQLERNKDKLLEKLENIDNATLSQQPDNKSWSIVQVVSHLIKIEQGTMQYMKKKLSYNPPLVKTGPITALKVWLTNISMKLPVKYKTADFLQEATNDVSLEQARSQWSETRQQMREFFEGLSKEQLTAALHKNLAAGRVSVYQQLSFIQVHLERHAKQINKIIKQLQ